MTNKSIKLILEEVVKLLPRRSGSELLLKIQNVTSAMVQRLVHFLVVLKNSKRFNLKAFLDSMPLSNVSVLFGPYCEYALAQVARLIKVNAVARIRVS